MHRHRNLVGATGFHEYDAVDQQGTAGVIPGAGGRFGEKLACGEVPVRGIGGGFEEFAQQQVRVHAGRRRRQIPRGRPVDGAHGLRRRRTRYPGTSGQDQHQHSAERQCPFHDVSPEGSSPDERAVTDLGPVGLSGSGLVVTLWPRTSGSVSRKQAP
ncbi:Uncharacterised protein [Mycobacteroides abscessus subsp. abscessus]|nr:Uncharacterised protein [Mycobacteroides abscessus subsp. abscessus]